MIENNPHFRSATTADVEPSHIHIPRPSRIARAAAHRVASASERAGKPIAANSSELAAIQALVNAVHAST